MAIQALINRPDKDPNLGFVEKFAYGMGDFGSQLLYTPVGALLIYYYTEYLSVNIATVAAIIMFSRIFDGVSDLAVGYLIEKTNSPYGKARSWLLRMEIPFFVGTEAIFSVPSGMCELLTLVYIFFSYNFAITICYTAINLPYGAMSTMMTQDSFQRSVIVIFRMLLATAGATFITAITLPLVNFFGNDKTAWTLAFVCIALMGCLCFFITFYFCHERVSAANAKQDPVSLKSIGLLFHNKYWIMLTITMVFLFSADVVFNTTNVYYCKYFLSDPEQIGTFAVCINTTKIASMIILFPLSIKMLGKGKSLLIASVIIIISLLLRMVDPGDYVLVLAASACYGLGQGFTYAAMFAMIPDTVEYGEYIDHERHEGLVYAGASFGTKFAAGFGAAIPGIVLSLGGYVNGAEEQTAEAMNSILWATTAIPAAMYIVGVVLMFFYTSLDRQNPSIIKELNRRRAEFAAKAQPVKA